MSRNTFILLGLLTGSVAMIGCSKNITAPSVSQEDPQGWRGDKFREEAKDAEVGNSVLVKAVPEPRADDQVEVEIEEVTPKAGGGLKGNKLRFNNLDLETGEDLTGGTSVEAKPINQGGPKGKLRFDMIDREAGDVEETPVQESQTEPLKNKWRQMQSDRQTGTEENGVNIVAPSPDPADRDV